MVVNLVIVGILLNCEARRIGVFMRVSQVGNRAFVKWRHGMGIEAQVVVTGLGVGIWWFGETVVIFRGEGRHFCSGIKFRVMWCESDLMNWCGEGERNGSFEVSVY
jgi:hypothetical protein